MIVSELVLHHDYRNGVAFDLSERRNHGRVEGATPQGDVLVFDGGPDRVRVQASDSLSDLQGLRVQVRFRVSPGTAPHRHNLIEGYLCFALVVNSDWSLAGSIYDRNGTWTGASSPPGVVSPGTWHTATFVHDGISAGRVLLDGVVVGEGFASPGPVGGVRRPHGLAIGHWPDPDDRYTLEGAIDSVKIWKVDRRSATELVDKCCLDRERWDEITHRGHEAGFHTPQVRDTTRQLIDLGTRLAARTYGGSGEDRRRGRRLATDGVVAMKMGDRQGLMSVIIAAARDLEAASTNGEITVEGNEMVSLVRSTPAGPTFDQLIEAVVGKRPVGIPPDLELMLTALCMGWAAPDVDRVEDPKKPKEPRDPRGPKDPKQPKEPKQTGPEPDPDLGDDWGTDADRHDDDPSGSPEEAR